MQQIFYSFQRLLRINFILLIVILLTGCAVQGRGNATRPVSYTGTTSLPVTSPDFKPFAGAWFSHGGGLTFHPDGHADFVARVYRWCGPNVSPPCDSFQGNNIISGDSEKFLFTRRTGSTAYGTIVSSTIGNQGATVSLALQPDNTVQLSTGSAKNPRILCGTKAPAGYCGA